MIATTRLHIRKWQDEDAQAFFELTQDDAFNAHSITIYRQESVNSALQWIRNNDGKYGVWERQTGVLLGMGGLTHWHWEGEKMVDITYRLRGSAQGKGFGQELALALSDYAFNILGLKEITATITPDNLASKRIASKMGMKFDKHILLLGIPTELHRLRADD